MKTCAGVAAPAHVFTASKWLHAALEPVLPLPLPLPLPGVITHSRACARRVYLARLAGTANARALPNEWALAGFLLEEFGFTIVDGAHDAEFWARLLADACLVVAPHGGALAHLPLLPVTRRADVAVVELDGHDKYALFWSTANALGAHYYWFGYDKDRGVDIAEFGRFLNATVLPRQADLRRASCEPASP